MAKIANMQGNTGYLMDFNDQKVVKALGFRAVSHFYENSAMTGRQQSHIFLNIPCN